MEILSNLSPGYTFHNIGHTCEVVSATELIVKESNLTEEDRIIVLVSAWFHDTGFSIGAYNHEGHSVKIAHQFLSDLGFPNHQRDKVLGCIRATRLPQRPMNKLEAILCDADMVHLAASNYWEKNLFLRKEQEFVLKEKIRDDQWCHENLNFLAQHKYHTRYGKKFLARMKEKHLSENVVKLESLKMS